MRLFKRVSLILMSAIIFVGSAFVFAGCGKDADDCKVYVFSSRGGVVQVDKNEEVVKFGDEGSRIFTYAKGDTIKLKAIPDDGYTFKKWQFTKTEYDYSLIANQAEAEFKVFDEELVIKAEFVVDSSVVTYTVSYPTNTIGYIFEVQDGYNTTVEDGGEFKFKINLLNDYSNSNVEVKANGQIIDADDNGIYVVVVNQDVSILVDGVELNQSTPNDPETNQPEGDEPTTPDVTKYGVFTVDNRFIMYPIGQSGFEVEEGESFTFVIVLKDGYKYDGSPIVKAGGTTLMEVEGVYVINSVNSNTEITIENIVEDIEEPEVTTMFEIYTNSTLFTIVKEGQSNANNSWEVEEGSNFAFSIKVADGYIEDGVEVKANGTKLTSVAGVYTIYDISQKIEITVVGIKEAPILPEIFTISTNGDKFTITPVAQSGFEVVSGERFIFRVIPVSGYKFGENVVVTANGVEVPLVDDEKYEYQIASVICDMQIEVSGIVEDIVQVFYTVSTNSKLFTMIADGQLDDSDCWEVLEGESFTFSIKVIDGYNANNIILKANGTVIECNNGKYTINSVMSNMVITAEGIEEDEITYVFALAFKDNIYVQVWLPESVELTLVQSQIKDEYKADELVLVDTEYDEPYTFEEIIDLVNEQCSTLQVVGFTIGGLNFIEVDGNNLKVNWNVLELVGSNYELVVKTKAI